MTGAAESPRPTGASIDHYELLAHLADGAQAEVHRAKDVHSGEEVVIKFPHAAVVDNPVLVARWRRQTRLTKALVHPNLQCRLDSEERHVEPYIVLEYASGGTLEDWVSAEDPVAVVQAVEWGRQLAEAHAYLHGLDVVHRDIKPGNILITDRLVVKLGDFGAASRTSRRRLWHSPAPPEGTPGYLSPEQILGQDGDERSDIYGWGVVMYQLLSGRLPFAGTTPVSAMEAQLRDAVTPLRELRADIPAGLDAVVLTALHRCPDRRYPSATALLKDLDGIDRLNLADFDLSTDPAMVGVIGGSEGAALLRFTFLVAAGFVTVVGLVILLTILLR